MAVAVATRGTTTEAAAAEPVGERCVAVEKKIPMAAAAVAIIMSSSVARSIGAA